MGRRCGESGKQKIADLSKEQDCLINVFFYFSSFSFSFSTSPSSPASFFLLETLHLFKLMLTLECPAYALVQWCGCGSRPSNQRMGPCPIVPSLGQYRVEQGAQDVLMTHDWPTSTSVEARTWYIRWCNIAGNSLTSWRGEGMAFPETVKREHEPIVSKY